MKTALEFLEEYREKSEKEVGYLSEGAILDAMDAYAKYVSSRRERRLKERYFIVSYYCDYTNGGNGNGFCYFEHIGFPSYSAISDLIRHDHPTVKTVSMTNIKELCKGDYENFIKDMT